MAVVLEQTTKCVEGVICWLFSCGGRQFIQPQLAVSSSDRLRHFYSIFTLFCVKNHFDCFSLCCTCFFHSNHSKETVIYSFFFICSGLTLMWSFRFWCFKQPSAAKTIADDTVHKAVLQTCSVPRCATSSHVAQLILVFWSFLPSFADDLSHLIRESGICISRTKAKWSRWILWSKFL